MDFFCLISLASLVLIFANAENAKEHCGKIHNGGCQQTGLLKLQETMNKNEDTCREECKKDESNCGAFILGKASNSLDAGKCITLKKKAVDECTAGPGSEGNWAMYALAVCHQDICSVLAFKGRPKEWSTSLKSVSGKNFFTQNECQSECEKTASCGFFRIKTSPSVSYGGCELYSSATYMSSLTGDFSVYKLVPCKSQGKIDCGKLRDGGCPEYRSHQIGAPVGTGFNEETCRKECEDTDKCAIFFLGKANGVCHLYRKSAVKGCTFQENEKDIYAMYTVKACKYAATTKAIPTTEKPATSACGESSTTLSDLASNEFVRCDQAILKLKNMCDDMSIKSACCETCKG